MAARGPGAAILRSTGPPSEPPLSSLLPVLVLAAAAVITLAVRRRERRLWAGRRISGGRKALVLNLVDRR